MAQRNLRPHTSPRAVVTAQDRLASPVARTSRLRQNGRGIWIIHYSQPDPKCRGRWRSGTFSTGSQNAAEAQRQFDQWLRQAQDEHAGVRPGDEATIEAICAAYLAAYQLRGTGDPSQFHALKAPRRLLGGFLPAGLNGELLGGYQSARRREAISDSTIRRELGALRAALNYGLKHDMTARIPVIEKPRESEPRAAYLRKDEEPRFWQAAQMWGQDKGPGGAALALFVALALDTAARRDAILGLTWERVHFDQELIDYRVPGRRVSRKRNTVVPINSRLMPLLRDAAARAPVDLAGRPVGRVLGCGEDIVKRRFRKFTADIGMPWVTPHVCRHTWASLAAQDGVPLFHIAKMLGDSVATVERTYAKLAPSDLHAVANRRFVGPTLRMV